MSPYSVRMRENAEQKNSEYGQFSSSKIFWTIKSKRDKLGYNFLDNSEIYKTMNIEMMKYVFFFCCIVYLVKYNNCKYKTLLNR